MSETISINPVTRISGFMEIQAQVDNNIIVSAKTKGMMFRNFEKMLMGRSPFDAIYFTQRICGICSSAHGIASAMCLEGALNITPSQQGRYLRDLLHACEFLQNHLRHFFQFTLPDYVKLPANYPLFQNENNDYRLPKDINDALVKDYFEALEMSRQSHEMLAILGGKAPHNHGVFIGGVASPITVDSIIAIQSILNTIGRFVNEKMIPDVYQIGKYYPEYYHLGTGYGNLLSYGCFDNYKDLGTLYVNPLVYTDGQISIFNPDKISVSTPYSWYDDAGTAAPEKADAYSWIKAPRYEGIPFEVGPLARQWLSGEYRNGISTMDRTIARVLETRKIVTIMQTLIQNLIPNVPMQQIYTLPDHASSSGLVDTTRGALAHWMTIDQEKIAFYQIISPSAWNLSAQTQDMPGTSEQALMGTPISDITAPIEIGRIIRSFDPCVSCATHVYCGGQEQYQMRIV